MFGQEPQLLFQIAETPTPTPDTLPANEPLTLSESTNDLPVVDDARWSADLTSNSLVALGFWIVLLIVLQAVAWPLVRRVFHRFPDKGWAFSRTLSLLLAAYPVWLLASIDVLLFRAIWCGISLVAVGALIWGLNRGSIKQAVPWYRNGPIVTVEIVFWAVFGLFLLYRLIQPDAYHPSWGGERPMEYAQLNATLRSPSFPPIDAWYGGGYINYYYYGTYLVAFMLKLTGIPSEIGFNLAQPVFIALIATAAFSISAAFARRFTRSTPVIIGGGLLSTVLMSFSGNAVAAARVVEQLRTAGPFRGDPWGYYVWNPSRAITGTINEFPYFTGLYADLHAHVVAWPITLLVIAVGYNLILNGRVLVVGLLKPTGNRPSFLWTVLTLGTLTIAIGTLFPTNAWDVPTFSALAAASVLTATRSIKNLPLRLGYSAGIVGFVGILAYLLVFPFYQHYVALFGSVERTRGATSFQEWESHFGLFVLVIVFGLGMVLISKIDRPSFLFDPLLFASALFVLLLGAWYVVEEARDDLDLLYILQIVLLVGGLIAVAMQGRLGKADFHLPGGIQYLVLSIVIMGSSIAIGAGYQVMALTLGIGGIAGWIWLRWQDVTIRFLALMIAAACFVIAGNEIFFLVDLLEGDPVWYRMNSVFKFYNGAWSLFALASTGLIVMMVVKLLEATASETEEEPSEQPSRSVLDATSWARVGTVVATIAIVISLAYPITATGPRLDMRFQNQERVWSLNALTWMDSGTIPMFVVENGVQIPQGDLTNSEDHQIIDWFNQEVPGTPMIAEASIGGYRCNGNRIANATGLPTIIGWSYHESQQRESTYFPERSADLRNLYTSDDPAEKERIINKYGLQYIVVGEIERYNIQVDGNNCVFNDNTAGIAAFDPLVGTRLEVAFTAGDSLVYRVIGD